MKKRTNIPLLNRVNSTFRDGHWKKLSLGKAFWASKSRKRKFLDERGEAIETSTWVLGVEWKRGCSGCEEWVGRFWTATPLITSAFHPTFILHQQQYSKSSRPDILQARSNNSLSKENGPALFTGWLKKHDIVLFLFVFIPRGLSYVIKIEVFFTFKSSFLGTFTPKGQVLFRSVEKWCKLRNCTEYNSVSHRTHCSLCCVSKVFVVN